MKKLICSGLALFAFWSVTSTASADSLSGQNRRDDISYLELLKKAETHGLKVESPSTDWKAFFLQEQADEELASMVQGALRQGISSDLYYVGENGKLFLDSSAVPSAAEESQTWKNHECLRSWGYGACSPARGRRCTPTSDRKSCY